MKRSSSIFNNGTKSGILSFTIGMLSSKRVKDLDREGMKHAIDWIAECEKDLKRFKDYMTELHNAKPIKP